MMFDASSMLSQHLASSSTKTNEQQDQMSPSRPNTEGPIPKKSKENIPEIKGKRWTWNDEKFDTLINQFIEYKGQRSYEGYDFEADLVIMYSDLRKIMSLMYPPSDFGLEELEIENLEGMTRADLLTYKRKIESQEKYQKQGYKRIKNKEKGLRSIVCIGISKPPSKIPPLNFLPSPRLKSANSPNPSF